ncbi:radical SAM protein [Myxococcota bacterium]|nr:radical SAM protein [Myxococcota bacterium]
MAVSWIVFHITDRCQLNCKHCLRDPEKGSHDLELGLLERLLDEVRRYGCEHVGLTGGEPTLHPQFEGILDAIVARDMTWHMISNGIRFATRVVPLLDADPRRQAAITAIDFSLDGADEAVHDRIRGEGSYRDVMTAISIAKMRSIPFMLQMSINAYNAHQLEQFALEAAALGAGRISFGMTMPTGTYLDQELFLPRAEWRRISDRIDRLSAIISTPVTRTDGFPDDHVFHECEPFRSEILHVDYDGMLNLCCMHAGVPGGQGTSDAIVDLHGASLVEGHRKMIQMVHEYRMAKLDAIERGALGPWGKFACNHCLAHFGKPHWTDAGASGATAARERWKGAWAPERHTGTAIPVNARLPIIHTKE